MKHQDTFTARLDHRLEESRAALAARGSDDERMMRDRQAAGERLAAAALPLHEHVLRPMVDELTRRFPNATAAHYRTPGGFVSECRFTHTPQYPATASA